MNEYEEYLPVEFKSGNDIPVERVTITRKRMLEILGGVYEQGNEDGWTAGVNSLL